MIAKLIQKIFGKQKDPVQSDTQTDYCDKELYNLEKYKKT